MAAGKGGQAAGVSRMCVPTLWSHWNKVFMGIPTPLADLLIVGRESAISFSAARSSLVDRLKMSLLNGKELLKRLSLLLVSALIETLIEAFDVLAGDKPFSKIFVHGTDSRG